MKHKISKLLLISLLLAHLPACIEVKDQDDDANAFVQTIQGGDLVIEEPLYLIGGEFLRESEMRNYENSQNPASVTSTYEYSFASLTLGPNGVLYTMGNKVSIRVQDLISRGGMIVSFPEGHRSSHGDGLSGGSLKVWAHSAEGNLKITMRGENGRQGLPGDPPLESMKGPVGREGAPTAGGGSMLGIVVGQPGFPGGKGQKGFPGKAGFAGGNSGTFELTVLEDHPIYLSVEIFAGKGGPGGFGGTGGAGGDGGLGGKIGGNKRLATGPQGLIGDQGDNGSSGTSGLIETACVSMAGVMKCAKENFNYSR